MRYWWVNQNQTYHHEVQGGYLWSPKRNANGARNPFYESMREVAPGDLIFFHLGVLHGGAGTAPGMRRRTVSLRFLGPDVVYDGRPRDEKGAQEGNDVALSGMYAGLKHGDPFRTGVLAKV